MASQYIFLSSEPRIFTISWATKICLKSYKKDSWQKYTSFKNFQGFLGSSSHNVGWDNSLNPSPQQHTGHSLLCFQNYLLIEHFFSLPQHHRAKSICPTQTHIHFKLFTKFLLTKNDP